MGHGYIRDQLNSVKILATKQRVGKLYFRLYKMVNTIFPFVEHLPDDQNV